jgi:hypothetical protein
MADNDNTNKWKWFFLMPMYVAPADNESAKAAAATYMGIKKNHFHLFVLSLSAITRMYHILRAD